MKAWVLGDNIDTDAIAPGRYMKFGIEEIARHCLESVVPAFSTEVRSGDVVVGGRNFGAGSSREQAPEALKHLGVAVLVAESFAGLFYRNAINLGLPAVACPQAKHIRQGDELEVDLERGKIHNRTTGETLDCEPVPSFLMNILRDGGLLANLEKRLLKPEDVVRRYLDAMERRDLTEAKRWLAPGFHMVFPGNRCFDTLEALVASAKERYRSARKTYERFDCSASEVYCFGTLHGELLDGTAYSGIRFIDRFTVRDGKLVDQQVWNDMAEVLGSRIKPL